jgi:hypothetical protein
MAYQRIDLLEQQFANLGSFLENIMKVDKTNSKVDNLVSKESSGGYGESSTAKSQGKHHSGSSNSIVPKLAKLDFLGTVTMKIPRAG